MKILALIPARSGSKRVKDKNIRMLGGIPLMVWSIRIAQKLGIECFVSTDSKEYAVISEAEFCTAIMRPECLATDSCGDREVIIHFLSKQPCDLLLYLRPTTPFRDAVVLERAIDEFIKSVNDSMRSVEEMGESAYKCFEIGWDILYPIYCQTRGDVTDTPNQDCPKTYHPNGYIDILKPEVVLKGGSIWGERKMAFITERTIEIDSEHDFWLAEQWLQRNKRP